MAEAGFSMGAFLFSGFSFRIPQIKGISITDSARDKQVFDLRCETSDFIVSGGS